MFDGCLVSLGLDEPTDVEKGILALEDVRLRNVGSPEDSRLLDALSSSSRVAE